MSEIPTKKHSVCISGFQKCEDQLLWQEICEELDVYCFFHVLNYLRAPMNIMVDSS